MSQSQLVIQFAKAPVAGKVKTRLIPHLGAARACELHWDMTSELVRSLSSSVSSFDFQLHVNDSESDEVIALAKKHGCLFKQQIAGDLGDRMSYALEQALKRYQRVAIVGSDCLAINEELLARLFDSLAFNDVALLPATDGGYAAIAMRQYVPSVFKNIEWGTATVLSETIQHLNKNNIDFHQLSPVSDIDNADDLKLYSDHKIVKRYL